VIDLNRLEELLNRLEKLLATASPGPWREDDGTVFCGPLEDARTAAVLAKVGGAPYEEEDLHLDAFVATTEQRHPESDADAELICALRNAAPDLIDEISTKQL